MLLLSEIRINEILFLSILFIFISSLSPIICASDSIYYNKRDCLFMDKIKSNEEIISFEYNEGYYRAIHRSYDISVNDAVKMKYLGNPSKDLLLKCSISPSHMNLFASNLYHYHIPCYIPNVAQLNEGTYCIEIVKKLVGDINSESFCANDYTFQVTRSTNIPSLTVVGFSDEQIGCVQRGDTVTLLASVSNKISNSQDYDKIGIGLANTEVVSDHISLHCKIEGQKSIGFSDRITCIIPDYISEGKYSIFYSADLVENYNCPNNIINAFNSLNFNGDNTKLNVYKGNNNENVESTLTNITFENPSKINLTFIINNIQNINSLSFDIILNKDIGIKLIDDLGTIIGTTCNIVKSNDIESIFYLICAPEYYEKEVQYSLLILDDITIGYNLGQILCTSGENNVYQKIIVKSAEYNLFIIYNDDNSPYLDCNLNENGFYQSEITNVKNFCSYCGKNCLICQNSNICSKCLDGFTLTNSKKCEFVNDKINFNKFQDLIDFIPHEESCDYLGNKNQLFSFKFSYIINKGEKFAIESEEFNDVIFGIKDEEKYGLNCIIEVNPDYIPDEQNYMMCKELTCTLFSYVNCSFHEKVSNGIYDIQADSNTDFGNLINKAKDKEQSIQIEFIDTKIIANILDDVIEVVYKGYLRNSENIYVCPNINSKLSECYELKDCVFKKYDIDKKESLFECSKEIDCNEKSCLNIERIVMKDDCDKYINESFEFKFYPDSLDSSDLSNSLNSSYSSNFSRVIFINLFLILTISLSYII